MSRVVSTLTRRDVGSPCPTRWTPCRGWVGVLGTRAGRLVGCGQLREQANTQIGPRAFSSQGQEGLSTGRHLDSGAGGTDCTKLCGTSPTGACCHVTWSSPVAAPENQGAAHARGTYCVFAKSPPEGSRALRGGAGCVSVNYNYPARNKT